MVEELISSRTRTKQNMFPLCQWEKASAIATMIVPLGCQAIYEEQMTGEENKLHYCVAKLTVDFVICKAFKWQLRL